MKKRAGFTLIEAVMVIVMLGLLAIPTSFFLSSFLRNVFFMPSQLETDMLASTAIEIMIEGDSKGPGLRFCKTMLWAGGNLLIFINRDNEAVTYTMNTGTGQLTRVIWIWPEHLIPYEPGSNIVMSGKDGSLFKYYDASENQVTNPLFGVLVRRVEIGLIARENTASGGYSEQLSSVRIN